jgi:hypothetical protein
MSFAITSEEGDLLLYGPLQSPPCVRQGDRSGHLRICSIAQPVVLSE